MFRILSFLIAVSTCCFAESTEEQINTTQSFSFSTNADEWQKQREFFQEHGYLWIKNFFSKEQVRLLCAWCDDINTESQSILSLTHNAGKHSQYFSKNIPGSLIVVSEAHDPLQVCRAEDMLSCYPELNAFVSGTVTSYIGRLFNEPYVLFKDKINFKWPGGGAFQPHQDFPAYDLFGPREHVTAMVCIDEATLENGCLHVAQNWKADFTKDETVDQALLKTGKVVLPYIEGGKDHGSIKPEYAKKINWLALEASPGDLVIFTSYLPHYSEPNKSKKARRAMFFTHNRLRDGDHRKAYYHTKRHDPLNPAFHFATPTKARNK